MNKYFKQIFIIFCFVCIIQSSNSIEPDNQNTVSSHGSPFQRSIKQASRHLSFLFEPTENPTCASILYKIGIGLALSLTADAIEDIDVTSYYHTGSAYTCRLISSKLCFDAIGEAFFFIYKYILFSQVDTYVKKHSNYHNITEDVYDRAIQRNKENLNYISRMGYYLFNVAKTIHAIKYIYLENLNNYLNKGINPFSFSSEQLTCGWGDSYIFCRPLTTPIFLAFYIAVLGHNLRELSFATNRSSFTERGEVPLFSFFNGNDNIGLSVKFLKAQGKDPGTLEYVRLYSKFLKDSSIYKQYVRELSYFDLNMYYFIKNYGNYQIVKSIFLTIKNLFIYFKDRPYIELIENSSSVASFFQDHKKKKRKDEIISFSSNPNPKDSISSKRMQNSPNFNVSMNTPSHIFKKNKVKKQGKQDIKKSKKHKDSKCKSRLEITFEKTKNFNANNNAIRETELEELKLLRKQHPISVIVINKKIKVLERFLNARIENITGSEKRLVWVINDRIYSMKYEVPHGNDASIYKGNKLKRILNIIEVGYLCGLSEGEINSYIEENQRYNLLRFPKFIFYLVGHANK